MYIIKAQERTKIQKGGSVLAQVGLQYKDLQTWATAVYLLDRARWKEDVRPKYIEPTLL